MKNKNPLYGGFLFTIFYPWKFIYPYVIIKITQNEYNLTKNKFSGVLMKNNVKKIIFLLITALLLAELSLFASALEFRKGANAVSPSYASSVYYKNLTAITLTGDGRTDVLAVALSQLGYNESNANGDFSGTASGSDNYTEYNYNMGSFGSGYGGDAYPWCASFVSFCLLQSGCTDQTSTDDWCRKHEGDSKYIWREVSCNRWAKQLRLCGYFKDSAAFDGDYFPIPADLVFFTDGTGHETHIGLVLYCDGEYIYTVEGNTSDAEGLEVNGGGVYTKKYPISSEYIRGYGVLPYNVNNDVCRIDYSGAVATAGSYISASAKYLYATENSASVLRTLPKYTVIKVTGIAGNGRLKAVCNINGVVVTGYIKNNADRVIQFSAAGESADYSPALYAWGYKGGSADGYDVGGGWQVEKPQAPKLNFSDTVGIKGWIAFSRKIERFGYYFDGNKEATVWDSAFMADASASEESLGGKYTKRYALCAELSSLGVGEHTVHFLVKLADGSVVQIEKIDFSVFNENKLTSLSVSGVSLSPAFTPDVTEYSVTVPNEVKRLDISATVPDGVKMTVDSPELKVAEVTEVKITVENEAGETRVYILRVMREAPVEDDETEDESAPPESDVEDSGEVTDEEASTDSEGALDTEESDGETKESIDKGGETEANGCKSAFGGTVAILISSLILAAAYVMGKEKLKE